MRPLMLTLLLSCGSDPLRIDLDTDSIPADLDHAAVDDAVTQAVAYWQHCGFAIERAQAAITDVVVLFHELGPGYEGYTVGPEVWIRRDGQYSFDPATCHDQVLLVELLKHELGHQLGLKHEPEEEAVMHVPIEVCRVKTWDEACQQ